MGEHVLCAAIYYKNGAPKHPNGAKNIDSGVVIGGYRHPNCIASFVQAFYPEWHTNAEHDKIRIHFLNNHIQGFLTTHGNFLDRQQAANMALVEGQINELRYSQRELYSEDLY